MLCGIWWLVMGDIRCYRDLMACVARYLMSAMGPSLWSQFWPTPNHTPEHAGCHCECRELISQPSLSCPGSSDFLQGLVMHSRSADPLRDSPAEADLTGVDMQSSGNLLNSFGNYTVSIPALPTISGTHWALDGFSMLIAARAWWHRRPR